jgi:hypothetical protein
MTGVRRRTRCTRATAIVGNVLRIRRATDAGQHNAAAVEMLHEAHA